MKCKFCGNEVGSNSSICPHCGKKNKKTLSLAVIILIVLFTIFVMIPVFLIIIALLLMPIYGLTPLFLVALFFEIIRSFFMGHFTQESIQISKSVNALKTVSVDFNKYMQKTEREKGSHYIDADDVWYYSILSRAQYSRISNGIRLNNGPEVFLKKLDRDCKPVPKEPSEINKGTACGILHIDVNGAKNGPNQYSLGTDKKDIHDRFMLLFYSNGVEPESGTIEYSILKSSKF